MKDSILFIKGIICGLFLLAGLPATAGAQATGSGFIAKLESELVTLAEKSLPAVVNISPYVPPSPSIARQGEPRERATNAGAGVIINGKQGYIVTNSHVVRKAQKVTITLYGGKKLVGNTLGYDEDTDLAVIKAESDEVLPEVELGDSAQLKVGQFAIAIGNPYGLNDTFTFGIISGLNRENVNISQYEDFIQTDASINPGNSGGPLFNIEGKVIGINTAIINYAQGIGFSIPSNTVKFVTRQLIENGEVKRGWMGVGIDFITDEVARKESIEKEDGVLINSVFDGQPADKAGLRVGDIILRIAGSKVDSPSKMIRLIGSITPGQTVNVDILRDGQKKTLSVLLAKRFEEPVQVAKLEPEEPRPLGFTVQGLDDAVRKSFNLANADGVVVTQVQPKSVAQDGGLQRGDVITAANGRKIFKKEDLDDVLQSRFEDQPLFFLVVRKEEKIHLTLYGTVDPMPQGGSAKPH